MPSPPFYVNKWASLAASLASLLVAGLGYIFALYADDLKRHLRLDQRGIDTVASAANLGSYMSLPAGATYDAFATRYPRAAPKLCMAVGASIMHFGYLALALAARAGGGGGVGGGDDPPSTPSPSFTLAFAALAAFAASNGATWLDAMALATAVRNHARQRGPAAGVLKGAVGLSGSVFTVVYAAAFAGNAPAFLAFLAVAPPAVALAAAPFVNVVPFDQADEWGRGGDSGGGALSPSARFAAAGAILVALAVYASTATIILRGPSAAALSAGARGAVVAGLAAVAALLALLPTGAGGLAARPAPGQGGVWREGEEEEEEDVAEDGVTAALLAERGGGEGSADAAPTSDDDDLATPLLPSLHPADAVRSAKFGLLFFTNFVVGGTGLTFINNAGALSAAVAAPAGPAILVSAFSVANCAGRLACGATSEAAMHTARVPRPAFLVLTATVATLAATAAALAPPAALPAVAALAGAAFGGHWALMAATVAELGGVKHYALNYAFMQLAAAAGSLGLARGLAGALYDREAARQGTPGYCEGPACFRTTFLVCAGLGAAAIVAATALTAISRTSYARLAAALAADDADRAALQAAADAAVAAALARGRARGGGAGAAPSTPVRTTSRPSLEERRATDALERVSATERRRARRSASLREW